MGGSVQGIQFLPNGIAAFFDDTRFEIGFPPETPMSGAEKQEAAALPEISCLRSR
jgi:hypothetical protein